ncbi:MAG TPA: TadE/TadG family type IV pilus assembly protein [Sandaracinaceae bacterium]
MRLVHERASRSPIASREGAAYVEFLLAFMPLFVLFLGIVQVSLLFAADLVVKHAAYRATRAAIVVLDDDPRYYRGEDRNALDGRHATRADVVYQLSRGGVGVQSGEIPQVVGSGPAPSRRASIELAAALVLLPLAPRDGDSVADAIGSEGLQSAIDETLARLDVDFVRRPSPSYRDAEPITVRVRYRFACRVPLVRALVCDQGGRWLVGEDTLPNQRARLEYR